MEDQADMSSIFSQATSVKIDRYCSLKRSDVVLFRHIVKPIFLEI
jgi:hypothetical protein